jgi:hypothetical protein
VPKIAEFANIAKQNLPNFTIFSQNFQNQIF